MGRAAVIVLALANLGYFAWSTGALAAFDLVPARLAATEPHRLARQIHPERLRIIPREQEQEEARAQARRQARESDTAATPAPSTSVVTPPPSESPQPPLPPQPSPPPR